VSPQTTSLVLVALDTSFEHPAPVRVVANAMTGYVNRLGAIWVEGQIAQLTRRPSTATVFMTLRDPLAEVSVQVTCHRSVLDAMPTPVTEGARVVVHAKFTYYVPRGSLSLQAREIRPVGVGELLARVEHLKRLLAAEGLLAAARKKPLPFLPACVGLVCGRASAAERDVVENARRRWPAVEFAIREVAVQGPNAVSEVRAALVELDADPAVEVIVIARGGGSLEDLLPFSNETLLRAAAACTTALVSAIGHEVDQPLLDLVADLRASTPTDAGKRIVPDMLAEIAGVQQARQRAESALRGRLNREAATVQGLRSRPVMADPGRLLRSFADEIAAARQRAARAARSRFTHAAQDVDHLTSRVRALSPAATLARGYAVAQTADGRVIRSPAQVSPGDRLRLRVDGGELAAEAL